MKAQKKTKPNIGAGSRGQLLPWKYFGSPLGDLPPPPPGNCILSKQTQSEVGEDLFFFKEHLLLGQERGPNPAKTFFYFYFYLENTGTRMRSKSGEDLFLENAYFWDRKAVQFLGVLYFGLNFCLKPRF